MNEALVNGPNAFLPSYDTGGALAWNTGPWSLRGVVMNVGENDDGNDFTFYGAQLGYTLQSELGEGNYRMLVDRTGEDFLDGQGESMHKRTSILSSFDQQLGNVVARISASAGRTMRAVMNYDDSGRGH
jgi:porin